MNRRTFVKSAGALSATTLVPITGFSAARKPKYKMGLQLFTIRGAMAKDPVSTLKQVKALGYEDTEIYGFDGAKGTYYGMKALDFKKLLNDLKLTATSGHYDFSSFFNQPMDKLLGYLDQCIEGAKVIDAKYITWPWLAPEYRTPDNFKALADKLNQMGEGVQSAGLGFAYHNHDFEFTPYNGTTGYDIILGETDPKLVKLQMDMYWVVRSSNSTPAELIAANPGRYVMWHIKDMDKMTQDYSELGNGSIDYVKMLSAIDTDALEYYYLEQGGNFATNSMQSITDSAEYFKKHLQKYL